MAHITPGRNGWTENAGQIARMINRKAQIARAEELEEEESFRREAAELQYYEDNHCFPRETGYFGTDTDAHLHNS
jgi:hypothetical protein